MFFFRPSSLYVLVSCCCLKPFLFSCLSPSLFPSFKLSIQLLLWFFTQVAEFLIFLFFLPLPRSLSSIHVPFGISQSPFSCPYLVLNWGGSSRFWFWWRIARNRDRGRERENNTGKHIGTRTQKKGTCRRSEVNNKIRPWSTWRRTTRHGELSWKPFHRKDERVHKSEFFCLAYQIYTGWGGNPQNKRVPKLEFSCFAPKSTKRFVPWDLDQNVVCRVSWQPTHRHIYKYGNVCVGERAALHGFFVGMQAPLPNSWNWFGQTISYLVLAVVVGKMLAAQAYK